MSDDPVATVRIVDGQMVLDDPMAEAMMDVLMDVLAKRNCLRMARLQADRVRHFDRRIAELGEDRTQMAITITNVDSTGGMDFATACFPPDQHPNWDEYRAKGQVPYARGLIHRIPVAEAFESFNPEIAKQLMEDTNVPVLVFDFGTVAVFHLDEVLGGE